MYIKNGLQYTILLKECQDVVEHIWIKIQYGTQSLVVGNVYRPPSSSRKNFISYFEDLLPQFFAHSNNIVCFGDFNIDQLLDFTYTTQFLNILETFNLKQFILEPTRITDQSQTLIDLVCGSLDLVVDSGVKHLNISDHSLIWCKLNFSVEINEPTTFSYRALDKINMVEFQSDLEKAPWQNIFSLESIDDKVSVFTETLLDIVDKHCPLRTCRKRSKPYLPWITDNVKLLQKLRNKALNKYRRTKNPLHFNYYKNLRNLTTTAIRREKKVYLNNKFQTCTVKEKWQELNKLNVISKKAKSIPENLKNVTELNRFFSTFANNIKTPNDALINFYNNNPLNIVQKFKFEEVSEEYVAGIILRIKTKSCGTDGVNITLIQLCCPFILPFITHIINSCIHHSYFPLDWKFGNVIPLPKQNKPTEFGHLRSISILPTLSKILEKVMEIQIRCFLDKNDILPMKQSGFRSGYSCATVLADVTDDIVTSLDKGDATILVLLDYSKAFDLMNPQTLNAVVKYIGFDDTALELVKSYFTDRKQRVVLEGKKSESVNITSGVPQGSILGPLLFSIYTVNITKCLEYCKYHMYCDDVQLTFSFKPSEANAAQEKINRDLNNILLASNQHLLSINPNKTVAMIFCANESRENLKRNIQLQIGNDNITYKSTARNLGLILDEKLKFSSHVNTCLQRAYSALKSIYPHRHYLCTNTKKLLCDSLVLSHFSFSDIVYGPFLDSFLKRRIQKVQNSCIRMIFGIPRWQRTSHKLKDLNWLNMFNRRNLHSLCMYFKILKNKKPTYLHRKVIRRHEIHDRNSRYRYLLEIPKHKKQIFKKGFSYGIASVVNQNIRLLDFSKSIYTFKKLARKAFITVNHV